MNATYAIGKKPEVLKSWISFKDYLDMPFCWTYFINLKSVSYQQNRTSDWHVLTLRTIVDKYVHGPREKIYACFADFKRAFDSVWHEELFIHKLLQIGVGGYFYKLIQNLYSNSSCTLKIGRSQTRSFHYLRGVRQGCILSPLLFKLIIY